jgi:hypothetical protein
VHKKNTWDNSSYFDIVLTLDVKYTWIQKHLLLQFVYNMHLLHTRNNSLNLFRLLDNVHQLYKTIKYFVIQINSLQKNRHGRVESKRSLINSTSSSYSSSVNASVKPVFKLTEFVYWIIDDIKWNNIRR